MVSLEERLPMSRESLVVDWASVYRLLSESSHCRARSSLSARSPLPDGEKRFWLLM